MKRIWRFLRFLLFAFLAVVAFAAGLFGYFVFTPNPKVPALSGTLIPGSFDASGLVRTYSTYVPRGLPRGAPLVLVLHGAGESGSRMRLETGYGFDRLADAHQFAVVYPNAHPSAQGDWNACGTVGDDSPSRARVDDVEFLTRLVQRLASEIGIDSGRAFAAGSSRGGFMVYRLALEAPLAFRAVAAVSANVHTPDNFKCKPAAGRTPSILIMNGTKDPLVPFAGGMVSLLGFSYKYGRVMSSRASAEYFVNLNHIVDPPETNAISASDGIRVETLTWGKSSSVEVELVVVEGGGHGIPQPYRRHPRLLGPSPKEPNGPELIWAFFDRQRR